MKTPFNKYAYAGFLLISAYYALYSHDYMSAASNMGIGLIFDPFDTEQKWNDRPRYQKIWLIVHLAITAALFGLGVGIADKFKM